MGVCLCASRQMHFLSESVYNFWKYWKSRGILNCSWKSGVYLKLLESFIISNVIFACQAICSTLYIGKFSGKIVHYDLRG